MNVLVVGQGGTLVLDEAFSEQPVSAVITITTPDGQALSTIDATFDDLEDETATVDNLILTLAASAKGAKVFTPSATAGTVGDLTAPGYRLLINRGGRKHYVAVSEYDVTPTVPPATQDSVTSFRLDEGLDFAVTAGDFAYGLRVSYEVDWSAVTDDHFTGTVMAKWVVTFSGGRTKTLMKVYDVVRQVLVKPATWADVIARRPDADNQTSEIRNKEQLVTVAWEDIVGMLYNMGIRHNLVFPDNSTVLRDVTVKQCLYNLSLHQNLPAPAIFENQGQDYTEFLRREIMASLGQFMVPVDKDKDGKLSREELNSAKAQVWFRKRYSDNE